MTDRRRPSPDLDRAVPFASVDLEAEARALGSPAPGATRERAARSLLQTETLGAVLTNLATGASIENEQPDEAATIQGIRGSCAVTVGDDSADLREGTLLAISLGIRWRLEATSDATVLVTVARARP